MNSLTARLMSRSGLSTSTPNRLPVHSTPRITSTMGLDPSNPLLPPVHNLRMVYLKEPLTNAEKDLHEARKALRVLETTYDDANKKALNKAMAKLQGRESQYFATRYIGRDKPRVLQGWKTHFTDKVDELLASAKDRETNYTGGKLPVTDSTYINVKIAKQLKDLDTTDLDSLKQNPSRSLYESLIALIEDDILDITKNLATVSNASPVDQDDVDVVNECLASARECTRLIELLMDNKREVPFDML